MLFFYPLLQYFFSPNSLKFFEVLHGLSLDSTREKRVGVRPIQKGGAGDGAPAEFVSTDENFTSEQRIELWYWSKFNEFGVTGKLRSRDSLWTPTLIFLVLI